MSAVTPQLVPVRASAAYALTRPTKSQCTRRRSGASDFAQSSDGRRRTLVKRYVNANQARLNGSDTSSNWPRNRLLLALPARNLKRLVPELEQISCQNDPRLLFLFCLGLPGHGVLQGNRDRDVADLDGLH